MLSGCAGSSASKAPVALNPVAGDIRAEFSRRTRIPQFKTRKEGLTLMGELVVSEKAKNRAGRRLMRQIDRARAFHKK